MGRLLYLKNVATLNLDIDKCVGCKKCTEVCPHGVFSVEDKKARMVDRDLCMECGACQNNCPADAISVGKGVGCAQAVLSGALSGTEPNCDCSDTCCDRGSQDNT
ncbi:MAG: mercury methylation ferredoxin HgcB [Planctomycetota bacterium]|jgi:NAD-dependent dihydropyrimidine dehydrogenase PreA subunit